MADCLQELESEYDLLCAFNEEFVLGTVQELKKKINQSIIVAMIKHFEARMKTRE